MINSFFTLFRSRCIVWDISSSNCSPLSSGARWHSGVTTQCANCSELRFNSRERQEKTFFAIFSRPCMHPYGGTGVPVAWSHLGRELETPRMRGSCWARGRIHYGMGVAAEILTFCLLLSFFLFFSLPPRPACFFPLPVSSRLRKWKYGVASFRLM